jgi:hypothetical protein
MLRFRARSNLRGEWVRYVTLSELAPDAVSERYALFMRGGATWDYRHLWKEVAIAALAGYLTYRQLDCPLPLIRQLLEHPIASGTALYLLADDLYVHRRERQGERSATLLVDLVRRGSRP